MIGTSSGKIVMVPVLLGVAVVELGSPVVTRSQRDGVDPNGVIRVTVEREARSLLLKRWSRAESWYDVEVDANSTWRRR